MRQHRQSCPLKDALLFVNTNFTKNKNLNTTYKLFDAKRVIPRAPLQKLSM